jgi:hypothetical protein
MSQNPARHFGVILASQQRFTLYSQPAACARVRLITQPSDSETPSHRRKHRKSIGFNLYRYLSAALSLVKRHRLRPALL